jgi:hypothetical protein
MVTFQFLFKGQLDAKEGFLPLLFYFSLSQDLDKPRDHRENLPRSAKRGLRRNDIKGRFP